MAVIVVVVVVNNRLDLCQYVSLVRLLGGLLVVVHMGWQDVDIGDGLHAAAAAAAAVGLGFGQLDRSQDAGIAFPCDNRLNSCLLEKHDWGCLL